MEDQEMEFDEGCRSNDGSSEDDEGSELLILTPGQVFKKMQDTISKVENVLQLPTRRMRNLLEYFKWDSDKLMEAYYDGKESKLFQAALSEEPDIPATNSNSGGSSTFHPDTQDYCGICVYPVEKEMFTAGCVHHYCGDCWDTYLTIKITEDIGANITCPGHKCTRVVDDTSVMSLVLNSNVKQGYQKLITNSFVESNRLMRWCPGIDCPNAIQVELIDEKPIQCQCGFTFCFRCGQMWHDAVSCSMVKNWLRKCQDDSETANWISANTKDCPKCGVAIEKNGGCNHMICTSTSCGNHFCWICLAAWGPDGYQSHPCSIYDKGNKGNVIAQRTSRAALERYLFYYTRYANHIQSMKLEHKLVSSIQYRVDFFAEQNILSRHEAAFLTTAIDTLRKCRRTLKHTHIFAYYVIKNNQSSIFEDNQQDLESATERLSGFLEKEFGMDDNMVGTIQKVQDLYRYCQKRRQQILDHVREGYDNSWWKFKES